MNLGVELDGMDEVDRTFARLRGNAANLTPLMSRVATEWERIQRQRFDAGGKPRFARLAESTRERKARQGLPMQPLVASGALRAAITGQRIVTADGFFIGVSRDLQWLAKIHRKGAGGRRAAGTPHREGNAPQGQRRMPARRVASVTRDDRRALQGVVRDWLLAPVSGFSFRPRLRVTR